MRVKMLKTRNFTPPEERRITIKYREGHGYTVKRSWGEIMVADGDAVEVEPPSRGWAAVEVVEPVEVEFVEAPAPRRRRVKAQAAEE